MQQATVSAQVLAHNAVHAAFAGFTGVTVRSQGSTLTLDKFTQCNFDSCILLCGKGLWEVPNQQGTNV